MNTYKLYNEDPYLLEFYADVLSCEFNEKKNMYEVVLDQTAFFPEEGGQMPDQGKLDRQAVMDVQISKNPETGEETIVHMVYYPIECDKQVKGVVDWKHRFDQMQQHSGEHIVSGLVHKYFHYDNVGFHLGPEEVTLDFNGSLTLKQLRFIEKEANQAIKENFLVDVSWPDPETLKTLDYRSKIELTGDVRIVEFPGYDTCACCAPHVERTGEIGLIKITNVQSHRGGVRVNILCGDRALADYTQKQDSVSSISVQLSAKPELVSEAVERLRMENATLKEQIIALQAALMKEKIAALPAPSESRHAILAAEQLDPIAARNAANQLTERYEGFCVILTGNDTDGYRYIIASHNLDCKELADKLRSEFNAKGGGSKPMIQGTIMSSRKELEAWILNQ